MVASPDACTLPPLCQPHATRLNVGGIDVRVWGIERLTGAELAVMFFVHASEGSKEQAERMCRPESQRPPQTLTQWALCRRSEIHSSADMEAPAVKSTRQGFIDGDIRRTVRLSGNPHMTEGPIRYVQKSWVPYD